MEFKKFSAGKYSYGTLESKILIKNLNNLDQSSKYEKIDNVNFEDQKFWDHYNDYTHENQKNIHKMLLHLSLCHTILVDDRTGKFNASSPDELALVNAAKFFGYSFARRDEENNMIINIQGKERSYKLLNILEFTSARKRMSIIVEDVTRDAYGQPEILVLTKGADSIIIPRLEEEKSPFLK